MVGFHVDDIIVSGESCATSSLPHPNLASLVLKVQDRKSVCTFFVMWLLPSIGAKTVTV